MQIGQVKKTAKASLKNRKLKAAGETLVYILLTGGISQVIYRILLSSISTIPSSYISYIITLIITSALIVGNYKYFMSFSNRDNDNSTKISLLFSGFNSFLKVFGYNLLIAVVVGVVLGITIILGLIVAISSGFNSLVLFILVLIAIAIYVVGIYLLLRLYFTLIIIAEDETMGLFSAIRESFRLTKGYVLKLLLFSFSFILWYLFCILIIPIFYVLPYVQLSFIDFYYELKKEKEEKITPVIE